MCIYIYVCVHIDTVFALLSHHLPAWPSFVSRVWSCLIHQTTRNEIQQDTRSTKKHHFFLRWWLPKVDVLPWKHLCLSFSQLWFCFLHPCPSKLPRNWRPNWGMRSWRWWSILSHWCSIAAAWLDHLGSNSIRNRMRDSWKAGKNREYIIEVPSR